MGIDSDVFGSSFSNEIGGVARLALARRARHGVSRRICSDLYNLGRRALADRTGRSRSPHYRGVTLVGLAIQSKTAKRQIVSCANPGLAMPVIGSGDFGSLAQSGHLVS